MTRLGVMKMALQELVISIRKISLVIMMIGIT